MKIPLALILFLTLILSTLSAAPILSIPMTGPNTDRANINMLYIHSHVLPGANDFQPSLQLSWCEQFLHLNVTVMDDALKAVPEKLWEGDSVEVFLATERGASEQVQYIFGIPDEGTEPIVKVIDKRNDPTSAASAEAHFSPKDDGYKLHLSIPLSTLGIAGANGVEFALQVKITDRDPGKDKPTNALLYERPGAHNNTNRMLTARLTDNKASRQSALRTGHWEASGNQWQATITAPPSYVGTSFTLVLDDQQTLNANFTLSKTGWAQAKVKGHLDTLPNRVSQADIRDTNGHLISLQPIILPHNSFFKALQAVKESGDFSKARQQYGQPLETNNQVIHGAGQSRDAFEAYSKALEASTQPQIYMLYRGLKNPPPEKWKQKIKDAVTPYKHGNLILQVGLSMTTDGSPWEHYEHEVAAGKYDENLLRLISFFKELDMPVMIRIGYEFNGTWNGYQPESYIAAFRHVTEVIRASGLNAATAWCFATKGDHNYMDYYPGDAYVDWWAIDLFEPQELTHPVTFQFLEDAHTHARPVLIGESTAKFVGVGDTEEAWKHWFAPYFALIRSTPGIQAFSYINWNWANYPMWSDWGDCRIQTNHDLLKRYQREMKHPLYKHAN